MKNRNSIPKILKHHLRWHIVIPRTILPAIEQHLKFKPVTLITGARQCGKTTLCKLISEKYGMSYVTLADRTERRSAELDPELFLKMHPAPLIIDEVQYAPELFQALEEIVDRLLFEGRDCAGMYVLTGSQVFKLMEGATQSMAGRIGIVDMVPLSQSEIAEREEIPFAVDPETDSRRSTELQFTVDSFYERLVRGSFPELYAKPDMPASMLYSDYVSTYIEKDVSQIINIRDMLKFEEFMELTASLTGQELVYESISDAIGIDGKTAKSWIGVLERSGIIHLLRPYTDRSPVRRMTKRPKIYFWDTGLACHLAKVADAASLKAGYLRGPMVETYIVNEIMKSHSNNGRNTGFHYFRDQGNEIDLVMTYGGVLTLIECKSGMTYSAKDVKAFDRLDHSLLEIGPSCLMCLTERMYPLKKDVYALPVTSI